MHERAHSHRRLQCALLRHSQAAVAAARLRAHPRSPQQRAADAVGYALGLAATGRGSFLHTQGQDMSWLAVHSLDVAAVYLLALAGLAALLVAAPRWAWRRLLRNGGVAGRARQSRGAKQE